MPDDHTPTLRLTERRNPRTASIDTATPTEIVRLIAFEDATVPGLVAKAEAQIAETIALVESALRSGGRLVYVGAGTSGRLGVLDASECPPTFGADPGQVVGIIAGGSEALVRSLEGAEDDTAAGRAAIETRGAGPGDVVVGIAASGITPFVQAALTEARSRGAKTVLVCCATPPGDLSPLLDVTIFVPTGPEVVTGSTRLKAGTATKLVLNTITTGAMIRIGKTYGNLMVDLQAKSAKLRDRGERIVMEVTGLDRPASAQAIVEAGGSVRTAIVMVALGLSREEANAALERNQHRLRALLGDPPPIQND